MTETLLLVGCLAALGFSAFFSGTETGVYCLNRVRLHLRGSLKDRHALRLTELMDNPRELLITTLVGTNLADYFATVCFTAFLLRFTLSSDYAEIAATLILTPLILVFGGVVPKDWFQREADRLMYPLAEALAGCRQLVRWTGVMYLLDRLSRVIIRRIDPTGVIEETDVLPRARMRRLLSEGAAGGALSPFQRATLERVMNLSRLRLAEVMVPLTRAATVPMNISREEVLRIARMAHFSRLPVYASTPQDVIGHVNVYDVLMDREQKPISSYILPVEKLPATETVLKALLKLQKERQVMGIVVNQHGRCLGLFTMKDLVEEIVGELEAW